MKNKTFDFADFLESKKSVGLCLAIGVLFLVSMYQKIMFIVEPENKELFLYPYEIRVILSHIESLFFGFATIIIMFQAERKDTKILYCCFEGLMIFLNLNRNSISDFLGTHSTFLLVCYLAIFGGTTFFILGTLAKQHRRTKAMQTAKQEAKEEKEKQERYRQEERERQRQEKNISVFLDPDNLPQNAYGSNNVTGFQINNKNMKQQATETKKSKAGRKPIPEEVKQEIKKELQNGGKVIETSKKYGVDKASVSRIKNNATT